jgi:S-DNA-T family DNA segregation ATPase FtsK/SpoIIIE
MSKNRRIKSSSSAAARESRGPRGQAAQAAHSGTRGREVGGILALGVSLFLVLALISLQGGGLLMGPFGSAVAGVVYGIAGLCSYALVILVLVGSVRLLMERRPALPAELVVGVVLGVVAVSTLLHLAAPDYRVAGHGPGGVVGEHIAEILRELISTAGTALLATVGLVVAVVVATPLRMRQVLGWLGAGGDAIWESITAAAAAVGRFVGDVFRAILPERDRDEYEPAYEDDEDPLELDAAAVARIKDPPIIERERSGAVPMADLAGDTERVDEDAAAHRVAELEAASKRKRKKPAVTTEIDMAPVPAPVAVANDEVSAPPVKKPRKATADAAPAAAAVAAAPALALVEPIAAAAEVKAGAPMIVESRFKHADEKTMAEREKQLDAERKGFVKIGDGAYQLPPIHLLAYDAGAQNAVDKSAMLELSARLTQTLENYGVKGDVVAIRPGPVVTMYEFAPAPGTRVNKIVNLTDDLAMALEALRVRIVAPIPGKAAVGIEVPNRTREKVFLKEILADDVFRKGKSRLPMALGKDIEGAPYVVDLARMPHLLVAGTTGSGKSVAVNTMITSLLYNSTPEEVRLIMVDPKMLELSIYEGIPHLLLPVVTDPRKANLALRWAVDEMDRRYDMLAQMGVRDISTFNEKAVKLRAKWEADKLRIAAEAAERAAGAGDGGDDDVDITSERGPEAVGSEPPHKLPYIVVVIDEFADLMMCAPKEVEISVARIAQKARAAGIHLVLATQRPSVDVITGLIKANFPSRMAFHVTSKVDSRTILDQGGAEALLGAGDMLFSDRGAAPMRLHGCYVDEEEIHKVVAFLKTQGRPVYNLDILKPRDEEGEGEGFAAESGGGGGGKVDDEMYDKAVHIVTTTRNASISWVQRQLRIGYNRAARLVEEMEKQGVVSPPDHTNKREVMVSAA